MLIKNLESSFGFLGKELT
jgi:hypothetical protein